MKIISLVVESVADLDVNNKATDHVINLAIPGGEDKEDMTLTICYLNELESIIRKEYA